MAGSNNHRGEGEGTGVVTFQAAGTAPGVPRSVALYGELAARQAVAKVLSWAGSSKTAATPGAKGKVES